MADEVVSTEVAAQVAPETNPVPPVTRPARKRTPGSAKTAPVATKAVPTPVSSPVPAPVSPDEGLTRTPMVLVAAGNTKNYAKFVPPADCGVTGALYAPLGTAQIRVLLLSPTE